MVSKHGNKHRQDHMGSQGERSLVSSVNAPCILRPEEGTRAGNLQTIPHSSSHQSWYRLLRAVIITLLPYGRQVRVPSYSDGSVAGFGSAGAVVKRRLWPFVSGQLHSDRAQFPPSTHTVLAKGPPSAEPGASLMSGASRRRRTAPLNPRQTPRCARLKPNQNNINPPVHDYHHPSLVICHDDRTETLISLLRL